MDGTRKIPPLVNSPPRWIHPHQIPPNLTLNQTLTLTQLPPDKNADTLSYQNILMQACLTIKLKLKKKVKDKEM